MSANVMAWQNSFFMSRLPKPKTQHVKFLTSVSLYLYSERNIANWIINPTWMYIFVDYEVKHLDLAILILPEPIAKT